MNQVTVLPGLPTEERVNTPATGHAQEHVGPLQQVQDVEHLGLVMSGWGGAVQLGHRSGRFAQHELRGKEIFTVLDNLTGNLFKD